MSSEQSFKLNCCRVGNGNNYVNRSRYLKARQHWFILCRKLLHLRQSKYSIFNGNARVKAWSPLVLKFSMVNGNLFQSFGQIVHKVYQTIFKALDK